MKNNRNYFSKARVETFSDGIFAVIITLLVLEIKIPQIENKNSSSELFAAIALLFPKVLSWMVSFLIVCVIWVNHHRIFEQIKILTHHLFWYNANLLLWCALIPFPTSVLGDYSNNPAALIVFGVVLSFAAFSFTIMRWHILRNTELLHDNVDIQHFKKATTKSLFFGPSLYLSGALCSLVHPYLAFAIYLFIPLYFIFFNSTKTKED